MELIDIDKIDPSPFQHRRHMNADKLRELAVSITRDGLIEPVVLRRCNGRFQLICGERRLRAVKEYTDKRTILSRVIKANDLEARRMCAAENLQRENLSVIETIETIVDLVDSELCGDEVYDSMGDSAIPRVRNLLAKLDSVRSSRDRGSKVADESNMLFHKFMEQVENIFKNLPKSLKWRSFYENDLQILMDTYEMRKDRPKLVSLKTVRFYASTSAFSLKSFRLFLFPDAHVIGAFQCGCCICHAEKENTGCYKSLRYSS